MAQQIALSIGVAFAALNLDSELISDLPPKPIDWRSFFSKDKATAEVKKEKQDPIDKLIEDEEYRKKIHSILEHEKKFCVGIIENSRHIDITDPKTMEKMNEYKEKHK